MNYIALTGRDMPGMATAAEILLDLVSAQLLPVAITLYVNDLATAIAVRERARPFGIGQLWRIGEDPTRPRLTPLVSFTVPGAALGNRPTLAACLARGLDHFRRQLPAPQSSTENVHG